MKIGFYEKFYLICLSIILTMLFFKGISEEIVITLGIGAIFFIGICLFFEDFFVRNSEENL